MRIQSVKITVLAAAIACYVALLSGCGSGKSSAPSGQRLKGESTERHFEQALHNLNRLDEFDVQVLSNQVISDLNHWIEDQPDDPNWKSDDLLNLLPQSYRDAAMPTHGRVDEMSFGYDDFFYLRQTIWSREVANWVTEQRNDRGFQWLIDRIKAAASEDERAQIDDSPDELLAAIQVAHPRLSVSDAAALADALRLFDWTTRNVQLRDLQPFTPVSTKQETTVQPDGTSRVEFRWGFPSQGGLPGPGYMYEPWEAMLYGVGDAWERARVFIQLTRQLNITAVMLAFDESQPASWWRPWLPAVYVGGELYLMDSSLGLPLPSFQGPGIATLAELVEAPATVRAWDVPEVKRGEVDEPSDEPETSILRYPVDDEDLAGVAVLIDASFAALSKRMAHLERQLVGKDRLVLTVRPSDLASELRACKGVKDVRIWTIPFDALMYSHAEKEILASSEDRRRDEVLRRRMFDELNHFFQARHLHFQGRLRGNRETRQLGAIDHYQKADRSDEQIWRLVNYNEETLKAMASPSTRRADEDSEGNVFSTTDDASSKRVPEAKWLSLDGLERALEEAGVKATEQDLKGMLGSQLSLKSMHSRYWMALALYELRSYPNSADWLRRLQSKFPGVARWSTGARYNLARAYEAMGDIERAAKLYRADTSPQRAGSVVRSRLVAGASEDD